MQDALREMLINYGRIPRENLYDNDSDLFNAGLDSFGMVDVMMVAEEEFDVVFTPAVLNRRSFATVNSLAQVSADLKRPDGDGKAAELAPRPPTDRLAAR